MEFDAGYFHGDRPEGYSDYGRSMWGGRWTFEGFAADLRGKSLEKGQPLSGRKVLVCGSAFGYIIEELLALGVDAWGLDLSAYAISQTPAAVADRNLLGDARLAADLDAARAAAGLKGNRKFDLIVTEDLLTCLASDAEAVALAELLRDYAKLVAHRVSVIPALVEHGYLIHTLAEWRALLGPGDWLFDYHTWQEG